MRLLMRRDRHVFSDGVLEILADEAEAIDAEEQAAARSALRICLTRFTKPLLGACAGDGHVKAIAEESGKLANALYKLLGRLREKLSACIHKDLKLQVS